jgi:galactofuranosylgalactofuranosylrhamnosyl-N-acetylglucosaminyl-diphospho-decaprenol beta-1,5/1,6-galactofuranosyltransferase
MHYGLAATLIKAVEDFLEGPEALEDGSAAAAAEIRRVRAAYPETAVRPMSELSELVPDFRDALTARAANPPGSERLTWLKRAVWLAADRPGRVGFVPAGDAHWWHVSTFSRAVVTDMGETGFRLRERDRGKAKDLARRGARALARLRSEGPAVAARYRAEQARLSSRENWARLFAPPA